MMRSTYFWLIHLVSGAAIAVLLGIHMVTQHLDTVTGFFGGDFTGATSWSSMIGRSGQGIWVALYIALLFFGLYHGTYGLRNVLLETTSSIRAGRIITWLLAVVAAAIFVWGAYVPLALFAG